jgi:Arc/MetJ family transcription regulator
MRDVYSTCMAKVRTNIEIEDEYVRTIMRRYRLRTKTEVVDLALRKLAAEPMTRDEALAMRGSNSIGELPEDQPPHGTAA